MYTRDPALSLLGSPSKKEVTHHPRQESELWDAEGERTVCRGIREDFLEEGKL